MVLDDCSSNFSDNYKRYLAHVLRELISVHHRKDIFLSRLWTILYNDQIQLLISNKFCVTNNEFQHSKQLTLQVFN